MSMTFPMQRPVPGDRRGLTDVPRRARLARDRGATASIWSPASTRPPRTRGWPRAKRCPYDLFVGIPIHRAPEPLAASGLAPNGWVPVDQTNLRTQFPNVYALGDVCTGPRTVPKAGIFAESAARVVADDITAVITGATRRRPTRPQACAMPSSATGSSARWRSTSFAGSLPRPSATTPRASTPPRRPSSARHVARGGSDPDWRQCLGSRTNRRTRRWRPLGRCFVSEAP